VKLRPKISKADFVCQRQRGKCVSQFDQLQAAMEISNFQCVNKNIKTNKFSSKHACGSPKGLTAMKKHVHQTCPGKKAIWFDQGHTCSIVFAI